MQILYGEPAALLTALLWTCTALLFEQASKRIGSLNVNLIRLAMALLLLTLFRWLTGNSPLPLSAPPAAWVWLSVSGFIGFFVGDLLLFEAFARIGSRIAMLIYTSVPLITALLGWLILGEIPGRLAYIGMAVTLCGIVWVVFFSRKKAGKILPVIDKAGLLLALGGSLGQAFGLICSKIGMGELDIFAATQIRILPALGAFLFVFLIRKSWPGLLAAMRDRKAMLYTSSGAFFGPFLGVSLSLAAIRTANTAVAATIMALVPVFIILPAAILFREKIGWIDILGAVIAVGGTAILFL